MAMASNLLAMQSLEGVLEGVGKQWLQVRQVQVPPFFMWSSCLGPQDH